MGLFKIIREKQAARKREEIRLEAENTITVTDFNSRLYIAHNGYPLFPMKDNSTQEEIVELLVSLRQNYINARIKQLNIQ